MIIRQKKLSCRNLRWLQDISLVSFRLFLFALGLFSSNGRDCNKKNWKKQDLSIYGFELIRLAPKLENLICCGLFFKNLIIFPKLSNFWKRYNISMGSNVQRQLQCQELGNTTIVTLQLFGLTSQRALYNGRSGRLKRRQIWIAVNSRYHIFNPISLHWETEKVSFQAREDSITLVSRREWRKLISLPFLPNRAWSTSSSSSSSQGWPQKSILTSKDPAWLSECLS